MNKMIVAVFDTEEKAFEGLSALKNLHGDGDITIHATAVLTKDEDGKLFVKSKSDKGPVGMAVGVLSGALIGIIGGPVGMAVGATIGMLGGMYYDLDKSGIDAGFVDEVSAAMTEKNIVVVADVEESWTVPVDTRIEQLGGMVFRRNRYEVVEDQMNREAQEIKAELDELNEELKEAKAEVKASIQTQIDHAKNKREELRQLIDRRKQQMTEEIDAKREKLQAQMEKAKKINHKKLEKRLANLEADYKKRKKKLEIASRELAEYIT